MKKTETGGFEGNSNSPVSLFEDSFVPASSSLKLFLVPNPRQNQILKQEWEREPG